MRTLPTVVVLVAVIGLSACGGGSKTQPPVPPAGPQIYLPLAVGNTWSYDCGGGVTITDNVTQTVTVGGQQAFALQLQFPNSPTQTFLLGNDSQGNTTIYGYLVNGAPMPVTPAAYISSSPKAMQSFNYPAEGGGTVNRVFVNFEPTNPTPLGVFQVASYNDSASGGKDIWGYAAGKGIMEQDHGNFDCKITSFHVQ